MGELDVAPEAPTRPPTLAPLRRVPRLRPAALVLGLAVLVLVLFGVAAVLTGGGGGNGRGHGAGSSAMVPAKPTPVKGTTLLAEPAAAALRPIRQAGTPPANIVDALAVPVGATLVGHTPSSAITLFDAQERFTVPGSQDGVIAFYRSELAAMKWHVDNVGPARGQADATEVLAQKAGSDGWYWEVGVVVSPTTFGPHSGPAGTTPFVLRLFEVNDAT